MREIEGRIDEKKERRREREGKEMERDRGRGRETERREGEERGKERSEETTMDPLLALFGGFMSATSFNPYIRGN